MNLINLPLLIKQSQTPKFRTFKHRLLRLYTPILLIGATALLYQGVLPRAAIASPANASTRVKLIATHQTASAAPAVVSTPPVIRNAPNCSADTSFQSAGEFSAPAGSTGLIQQIDSPYSHRIYGNTAAQMTALSYKCPLVVAGDKKPYINAYTSYWLGWQASYTVGEDNQCRVSGQQVLLHIRQALPVWQNASGASRELTTAWGAYSTAVSTHENGHMQLDKSYAVQLLNNLQNFPPTSCESIAQAVDSMASSLISRLDQANNSYDAQTRHGELQGAIIP